MPCRIRSRKLWTARLILESMEHSDQCFVTLTYEEKYVPPGGSLAPRDAVLWLKRLRAAVYPVKLRYFLVGEYGEKTSRPHYHALLFGLPLSAQSVELVKSTWGKGNVQLGDVSQASIRYTVGYVLKKLTAPGRCGSRAPEFARMSRCPGIGHGSAMRVVKSLMAVPAAHSALKSVPTTVRVGSQELMLGKYLREVLSKELGLPVVSEERRQEYLEELFDLCKGGLSVEEAAKEPNRALIAEKREALFSSRRKL